VPNRATIEIVRITHSPICKFGQTAKSPADLQRYVDVALEFVATLSPK